MEISKIRLQEMKALLENTEFKGAEFFPLTGDASFRRYIRIRKGSTSAMLMDAPPDKENVQPFIMNAEYLYNKGYSAPRIIAQNIQSGLLLLEDLGDDSFSSVLRKSGADKAPETMLYEAAIDVLAEWHNTESFSSAGPLKIPAYDRVTLMREIRLFSEWYLPQVLGKEKAQRLKPEYESIWDDILSQVLLTETQWVHRDYHADNLMWLPHRAASKRVGLLDFQDALYGDAAYDLVSLLEDARRDVPHALADAMLARYIQRTGADSRQLKTAYAVLGAQRNTKIIGIFSRLAARDGKKAYLQFLPRVWRYLESDVMHPLLMPLKEWLDEYVSPEERGIISIKHTSEELQLSA